MRVISIPCQRQNKPSFEMKFYVPKEVDKKLFDRITELKSINDRSSGGSEKAARKKLLKESFVFLKDLHHLQ